MFAVGDVVGSYRILAPLRSGGMADLYLAQREGAAGFRRLVAIKVVHPHHAEDPQLVRMFLDEARLTARIDHPNVVHVEDLGEVSGTYFLVMEYVHGASLGQLLRALGQKRRRLSPAVCVAIAARVAEGLHAAHETTDDAGGLVNLVHRDVSPQNILLSHKGHVKLIDFGVAKAALRSEQTNVATLKGKVRYMAPEQAQGGVVDRRTDIYSLAIVLWEMLTMRRLFVGKTEFEVLLKVRDPKIAPPSAHVKDLPRELDEVIVAALSPEPDARPANAKVFRRMLAKALPRAMALDSAHLAELLASLAADVLETSRHDLPQEVSRVLQAEQLRAAVFEPIDDGETTTKKRTSGAVEVMTETTDIADVGEEDDDEKALTKPGSPRAKQRSEEIAVPASMQDEPDPTLVDGVPEGLRRPIAPPAPATPRRAASIPRLLAAVAAALAGGALLFVAGTVVLSPPPAPVSASPDAAVVVPATPPPGARIDASLDASLGTEQHASAAAPIASDAGTLDATDASTPARRRPPRRRKR